MKDSLHKNGTLDKFQFEDLPLYIKILKMLLQSKNNVPHYYEC